VDISDTSVIRFTPYVLPQWKKVYEEKENKEKNFVFFSQKIFLVILFFFEPQSFTKAKQSSKD